MMLLHCILYIQSTSQFSANPGRFSLTEISIDDNGQESTEIRAEFEWGQETIETIRNVNTKMFDSLEPAEQEMFLVSSKYQNNSYIIVRDCSR